MALLLLLLLSQKRKRAVGTMGIVNESNEAVLIFSSNLLLSKLTCKWGNVSGHNSVISMTL